jgi:hypothetical protein
MPHFRCHSRRFSPFSSRPENTGNSQAEGEGKLTVRNRLKAAAERRGLTIEFIRTPGSSIRFKVVGDGTEVFAAAPEEEELTEAVA